MMCLFSTSTSPSRGDCTPRAFIFYFSMRTYGNEADSAFIFMLHTALRVGNEQFYFYLGNHYIRPREVRSVYFLFWYHCRTGRSDFLFFIFLLLCGSTKCQIFIFSWVRAARDARGAGVPSQAWAGAEPADRKAGSPCKYETPSPRQAPRT